MRQKELTTASVIRDTSMVVNDTIPEQEIPPAPQVEIPETVPPPLNASVMATPSRSFHVIVASQPTRALAEKELKYFRAKGHAGAQIVFKDGVHYRVSIARFSTEKEALDNLSFYARTLNVRGPWVTFY